MNPWPHGPERRKTLEKSIKIGKRHNFDTKFSKFFHILPRYRYAFLIWRSRGEIFMKIRALTLRLRRVLFIKNNIAVPARAFLSFSAFCVVRGTLPWAILAPVRGIKAFIGAKRHLFARPRAYKHVRALNYG